MKAFLPEEQRAAPIVAAVKSVSQQVGRSLAQVALAWLRYRPVPVIPIIGARKVNQLQDNLASLELKLSPEQLKNPRRGQPRGAGIPSRSLRQRDGACDEVWRHVGSLDALSAEYSAR